MADIQDRLKKMPPFDPQEHTSQDNPPVEKKEEEQTQPPQEQQPQKPQVKEEQPKEEPKEEQPKEEPKEEQPKKEEPTLPEEASDRTKKEFEKLKKHNQELKEALKKQTDVLTSLQPDVIAPPSPPNRFTPYFQDVFTNKPPTTEEYPHLTQEQIDQTFNNLVDDEGYVNVDLLKEELKKQNEKNRILEQRVREAEELARQTKKTFDDYQRTQEMKKIHQEFPQIDPESPQFDERMWEAVRNEIIGQWMTQGKEDVRAACEKWVKILYPNMTKDKQADKKAQINAVSPQPTSTVKSWEDHEELVIATRKGKKGALAERLRRSGY